MTTFPPDGGGLPEPSRLPRARSGVEVPVRSEGPAAPPRLTGIHTHLRVVAPGSQLGLSRGDCVVCIPVYGGYKLFGDCLHSVLAHTPAEVGVLVADDCSPDDAMRRLLEELDASGILDRPVHYARQPTNIGFVLNANSAFASADPADVIILNSDCVVAEGWFEGLRDAAYSDTVIATSSALTNHGTILSVPNRNQPGPLPQDWTIDQAAAAVRRASRRIRPRLPTAIGHCTYIKRAALDLVGDFDQTFSPGYGEEVDFSQRCLIRGLSPVAADDVLVWHQGGGSFSTGPAAERMRQQHEQIVESRYPYYAPAVEEMAASPTGPLARSLGIARRALLGMSVTVDGSCLGSYLQGTQVAVLELIHALSATGEVRVRVVLPDQTGKEAKRFLSQLTDIETVIWDDVESGIAKTDIVHRAYQVGTQDDLVKLRWLGERLVITQQDMIAYRNPSYFPHYGEWSRYRQTTRDALGMADAVVFFSQYAAADALAEDLVDPARAHVVGAGTDHRLAGMERISRRPRGTQRLEGTEFLLCIGADYNHKNRMFALSLLDELQCRHSWGGHVALVGPRVSWGSSHSEEAQYLLRHPRVAKATTRLPAVSEAEKLWLMQHATGVLYPTVYEGFGLIPFEAAAAGKPSFFAMQASLQEVLPEEVATVIPWDAAATADRIIEVLRDPARCGDLVERIRTVGEAHTWDLVARRLLGVYQRTADAPPSVGLSQGVFDPAVTAVGRKLVGEHGALSRSMQNALWALAQRRYLAAPLFGTVRAMYHLWGWLSRPFRGNH